MASGNRYGVGEDNLLARAGLLSIYPQIGRLAQGRVVGIEAQSPDAPDALEHLGALWKRQN